MIPTLKEYRCSCGKLLFKGSLDVPSFVEIKCKRCDKITSFGKMEKEDIPVPFIMEVDKNNIVTNYYGPELIFGYHRDEMIGRKLKSVCPILNDAAENSEARNIKKKFLYKVKNSFFVLRDGGIVCPLHTLVFGVYNYT
jgi:phage FluMu protein Com